MELNDKQKAILEVAEKIISEKGFEATSIRDISKQANINLAMVSYYFGSKEKLLEALFQYRMNEVRLRLENLFQDKSLSNLDKIFLMVDIYVEKVFQNNNFHKIMLIESPHLQSPIVFDSIKKLKLINREAINPILQNGIENGEFNAKIDLDQLIAVILGTTSYIVLNEKFYRFFWNLKDELSFGEQVKERVKSQIKYSIKAILKYDV